MTAPADVTTLMLRLARARLAQSHLRKLLGAADANVADCGRELRNLKARHARHRSRQMPERHP